MRNSQKQSRLALNLVPQTADLLAVQLDRVEESLKMHSGEQRSELETMEPMLVVMKMGPWVGLRFVEVREDFDVGTV